MKLKALLAAGLLTTTTAFGAMAPALGAGRDLAILVVGNGTDRDLAARERTVIETLTRLRLQRGWNHKLLPIYSYHFDKPAERSYCEERLKVKAGDLVLVGLVELDSGVPVDFVYRESDVMSAGVAADKVMDRARTELSARGRLAATVPAAVSAPARPPASTSASSPARPPASTSASSPAAASSPARPPASTSASSPAAASSPARPPASAATRPSASAPARPGAVVVTTAPLTPVLRPAPPKTPSRPSSATTTPSTPPATPPAVTPPVDATGATEKWAVQIGLFSTLEKARLAIEKMRETLSDVQAEIRKGTKDGQVVYRVVVGTFASQAEAYARAKSFTESGVQGFSVRLDPALGIVVK